jgi:hypothetical protein
VSDMYSNQPPFIFLLLSRHCVWANKVRLILIISVSSVLTIVIDNTLCTEAVVFPVLYQR